MNVSNGSHSGRVFGQSCAEIAPDEATAFVMLDDFRSGFLAGVFHGRSFQKVDGSIYFRLTFWQNRRR